MAFRDIFKKKESRSVTMQELIDSGFLLGTLNLLGTGSYDQSMALKLSSVYRAVNVIADSVAVLPLDVYQWKENWKYKQYDDLYHLLNTQPNALMSAYTFKKQMVQYILLKGNAYIYIERDGKDNPQRLTLLNSDHVRVMLDTKSERKYYVYTDSADDESAGQIIEDDDMIHIMNYSPNGLAGVSTLTYASMTLETAYASEDHANNWFKGGGNSAGILSPKEGVNVSAAKAKAAKESLKKELSLANEGQSNSIFVLDAGLEYQPITVSPKDAQLLESRQFNFITICQYFGTPPSKIFDLSKSSYNSNEAQQIDFLTSTMQPLLEKIELEFFRKLFTRIDYNNAELRFDVENLLRMDSTTRATYFSQMFQVGAYTPNEIRQRINGERPIKGGNRAFIQVNVQPLDNLISEQKDTNDNSNQIDNKLK